MTPWSIRDDHDADGKVRDSLQQFLPDQQAQMLSEARFSARRLTELPADHPGPGERRIQRPLLVNPNDQPSLWWQ